MSRIRIPVKESPYSLEIPVEQILPWEGNPTARTATKAMTSLTASINESQAVTEVAAVNNGNDTVTLGDGHRRFQVATLLGFKTLWVKVFPNTFTPGEVYTLMNDGVRKQSAVDWLEAHLQGDILPRSKGLAAQIKLCVRICGSKAETRRIMLNGGRQITPTVMGVVQSATNFLEGDRALREGRQTVISEAHRQVFAWVVKHKEQKLRALLSTPLLTPAKKLRLLRHAIDHDCDLQ